LSLPADGASPAVALPTPLDRVFRRFRSPPGRPTATPLVHAAAWVKDASHRRPPLKLVVTSDTPRRCPSEGTKEVSTTPPFLRKNPISSPHTHLRKVQGMASRGPCLKAPSPQNFAPVLSCEHPSSGVAHPHSHLDLSHRGPSYKSSSAWYPRATSAETPGKVRTAARHLFRPDVFGSRDKRNPSPEEPTIVKQTLSPPESALFLLLWKADRQATFLKKTSLMAAAT